MPPAKSRAVGSYCSITRTQEIEGARTERGFYFSTDRLAAMAEELTFREDGLSAIAAGHRFEKRTFHSINAYNRRWQTRSV